MSRYNNYTNGLFMTKTTNKFLYANKNFYNLNNNIKTYM